MSCRMLGLFMILPVFSVYAAHIHGATPALIGITLGIYGLTQACLQIPLGFLSDHIGRKPVIMLGLSVFMIGSVIAALSHSIDFLILGRAVQGAGAIGSTVLALVGDLTLPESRGKAMALIGMTIGISFTIAMILGPIINHWIQLSGIFWITALLAILGIGLIATISTPTKSQPATQVTFLSVFRDLSLLRLNFGIFSLHAILTALFIVIPLLFTRQFLLSEYQQIGLYCILFITSFMIAIPLIVIAEKHGKMRSIFTIAIAMIVIVLCLFAFIDKNTLMTSILLLLFFVSFTLLEALLPSLVSKIAPPDKKGLAMGIYSSSQFLGIFAGGAVGGIVFARAGMHGVFLMCAGIAAIWLITVLRSAVAAGNLVDSKTLMARSVSPTHET